MFPCISHKVACEGISMWRDTQYTMNYCVFWPALCLQPGEPGDTPYHPRETTNMRTQTVASYFRVRLFSQFSPPKLLDKPSIKLPHGFHSSYTFSSTLWWTCFPRWWQGSLTLFAVSNQTTIAKPTSSTGRRSWFSCDTLEFWRRLRSDGRATLTASCLPTS